jgi:hypothetical protein
LKEGVGLEEIRARGDWFKDQLRKAVPPHFHESLILSAEELSHYRVEELQNLATFLNGIGLDTTPLAYVRTMKASIESRFQQELKEPVPGKAPLNLKRHEFACSGYRFRVRKFDELFGADSVKLFLYERVLKEDGCVVRHFCHTLGIAQVPQAPRRTNEALGMDAVRFLYAYRKFDPHYGVGQMAIDGNRRLTQRLLLLGGPNFFFHSSLLLKHEQNWRQDVDWISKRMGEDMLGDIHADDERDCLRDEEDLYRFSKGSLDWLARETGVSFQSLQGGDPEKVAQAVARLKEPVVMQRKRAGLWEGLIGRCG